MRLKASVFFGLSVAFCLTTIYAQQTSAPAQKQTTETNVLNLKATSANVKEVGTVVRVDVLRWSGDEERTSLLAAMNPPAASAAGARGARGGGARGARGAGAQADPDGADAADPDAPAPARGGRGGRGGRGDAPAAPFDPIVALTAAIGKAPTIGYVWTPDVTGYSIKYAYHAPLPDGGERVILAADRRLGGYTTAWNPAVPATPTTYEFTLFEFRLDSKGLGEGKTSLTTKVIVDNEAKTLALDNYAAAPAMLKNVKR